jgi:metal-sulfur cluster biosynthetic enzyme
MIINIIINVRRKKEGVANKFTEAELLGKLVDVVDPELGYSIVDLGLVYRVEHTDEGIEVDFTLTSPACPLGEELRTDIVLTLRERTGESLVQANIVWDPPWNPDRLTDEMKLELGFPIW